MSTHQRGPLVAPGRYSVRLTVDGTSKTAPLEIMLDPHSPSSAADLVNATKLELRIAADVARVSDKVNLIEQMRHAGCRC